MFGIIGWISDPGGAVTDLRKEPHRVSAIQRGEELMEDK